MGAVAVAAIASAALGALGAAPRGAPVAEPADVARRVAASMLAHPNYTQPGCASGCAFFDWGYCGAIVMNGLYTAAAAGLLPRALADRADSYVGQRLDYFLRTPGVMGDTGDCGDSWVSGSLLAGNYSMGC
eukprot:gene43695-38454_t